MGRRALLGVGAWVYLRHWQLFNSFPYKFAELVDMRRSMSERAAIAALWRSMQACCVPEGISRELHKRVPQVDLLTPKYLRLLRAWSFATTTSIADVEAVHAGNRSRAHIQMTWPHFAAAFVNSESRQLKQRRDARARAPEVCRHATRRKPKLPLGQRAVFKGQSPLRLFRRDFMEAHTICGRAYNPCSKEHWDLIRREYSALSPERVLEYKQRAEASKVNAAKARKDRKNVAMPMRGHRGSSRCRQSLGVDLGFGSEGLAAPNAQNGSTAPAPPLQIPAPNPKHVLCPL